MQIIGVIGAGQMGAGIAQTAARHGYFVFISDLDIERAKAAKTTISRALRRLEERGKLEGKGNDAHPTDGESHKTARSGRRTPWPDLHNMEEPQSAGAD